MTDITVYEGVPYNETCGISIDGVTGSTVGYSARWTIARQGVVVLTLVEGAGVSTTARAGGVDIVLQLSAVVTGALEEPSYDYQLDLLLSGSVVLRPLHGVIVMSRDVVAG